VKPSSGISDMVINKIIDFATDSNGLQEQNPAQLKSLNKKV
jgi:hypothetical protein